MENIRVILVSVLVFLCCFSCIEITPINPPILKVSPGEGSGCIAPSLEKNVVGTWHFTSTFSYSKTSPSGVVTFNSDGTITDPDSLFENSLDIGRITKKTYTPNFPSPFPEYPADIFRVDLFTDKSKAGYYFTLVSNECNKIVLRQFYSANNGNRFELTR